MPAISKSLKNPLNTIKSLKSGGCCYCCRYNFYAYISVKEQAFLVFISILWFLQAF